MTEPAAGLCTVPVLDVCGNGDDIAGHEALGRLALLLIPALAVDADEDLPAAALGMVYVPVIAAARLEGDVCEEQCRAGSRQRLEIASAGKVFGIRVVRLAEAEKAAVGSGSLVVCIYLLCHAECGPGIRPSGIEGDVS